MLSEPNAYADMPPTRLIPQPDGTPLPPRDPHIADGWPPEVKAFVDNMLSVFKDRETAPTVDEIERRFQIKLKEQPPSQYESPTVRRYAVTDSPYLHAEWSGTARLYQSYAADKGGPENKTELYILGLPLSNATTCLNPYELAVYTGSSFVNGEIPPPHGPIPTGTIFVPRVGLRHLWRLGRIERGLRCSKETRLRCRMR